MAARVGVITVGVDGSAAADQAVAWAVEEAQRRDLSVQFVHVWSTPLVVAGPTSALAVPSMLDSATTAAHLSVEAAAKQAADAGVSAGVEVVEGDPTRVLLQLSRSADQLVVGARGHSAMLRAVLGSVSNSLVHHAVTPVTVVRAPAPRERGVVVGVDGSASSRAALRRAAVEARGYDGKLRVVSAFRMLDADLVGEFSGPRDPTADDLRDLAEKRARRAMLVEQEALEGLQPQVVVRHGEAARVLCAESEQAALLVVGTRGLGAFDRMLLGSTSGQVVHHAQCPVQVVPEH